jgi:hypothetical protein
MSQNLAPNVVLPLLQRGDSVLINTWSLVPKDSQEQVQFVVSPKDLGTSIPKLWASLSCPSVQRSPTHPHLSCLPSYWWPQPATSQSAVSASEGGAALLGRHTG